MQVIEIFARDVQPIRLANIQNMSDVVVIAGPNGVGKTRLIGGLLQHIQNPTVDPKRRGLPCDPPGDQRAAARLHLLRTSRRPSKCSSESIVFQWRLGTKIL
jgi:ABC-type cobalamin/Fe3+-siderophores transport system ATPase subunit